MTKKPGEIESFDDNWLGEGVLFNGKAVDIVCRPELKIVNTVY